MKIVLVSFGSFGDIYPFLWLAQTLNRKGHKTTMITNKFFEKVFIEHNIHCIGIGSVEGYETTLNSVNYNNKNSSLKEAKQILYNLFIKPVKETILKISEIKTPDTLILTHILGFGAGLASLKFSIQRMNINLSPMVISDLKKVKDIGSFLTQKISRTINNMVYNIFYDKHINEISKEFDITLPRKKKIHWMLNTKTLCFFPEWFKDFEIDPSNQIQFIGFPEIHTNTPVPDNLKTFLKKNPKPILFTPGTAFRNNIPFFSKAVKVLKKLNKSGILLAKGIHSYPEKFPENVFIADFLPLEKILDQCSLIIHHGGIGTTAQSLRSSVPQIILFHPGLDQKNNAAIAQKLGVCCKCKFSKISSEILIKFSRILLTDTIKNKCIEISQKIKAKPSTKALMEYFTKHV